MAYSVTLPANVRYAATAAALKLDSIWLLSGEDNAARTVRMQLPTDQVVYVVHPGLRQGVIAGGVEFKRNQLAQHRIGRDYHQTTTGASLASAMFVPPDRMRQAASNFGIALPSLDKSHMMTPRFMALQRLMRLNVGALRLVRSEEETIGSASAMRGLENSLFEALADCLAGADIETNSPANVRGEWIIKRLNDVLASNPNTSLSVEDACVQIGIHARTLRMSCEAHIGMSPKQFLVLRRMHMARRKLLDSSRYTTKVSEVATEYGFWELGRFAVAYRRLFGEMPSQTLGLPSEQEIEHPLNASSEAGMGKAWTGGAWSAALAWLNDIELETAGAVFARG